MPRLLPALLTLALAPAAFAAGPTWQAGFAKVAITPDTPMWMSGYAARTKPAEGKETDLWAKAAVLQDAGGNKLVLVTLDLVGIDRELSQAVCKLIRDKHRVPREAVILSCSHTHCGPVVGTTLRSMYFLDPDQAKLVNDYTDRLPGKILEAVDAAVAGLAPVTLKSGVGTSRFAVNRRENPEKDVPGLKAGGRLKGPVDHDVPVLAAYSAADGKLRGVVFGYACHATVLSYQKWCGDYPGFAMIELEAAHPGAVALFFAGCGADQNPLPRRTVELAKDYGRQLASAVGEVLRGSMTTLTPESAASYREVALPLAEVPTREALAKATLGGDKYEAARAKMLWKKLEADGSIPTAYPYPVQAWRLGKDLTLLALGGEVVVDYSLRLRKELGAGTWVMGYANDVMAYIPSARVLKEGGYEGARSMVFYGLPSVWGPRVEEVVVTEARRQADAVRGKSR